MLSSIPQRLPRLESLNNKRAENEIYQSFQRVYESLDIYIKELEIKVNKLSAELGGRIQEQSNLVNGFGTQLVNVQSGIATLGEGSISSVGLIAPSIFNVSGSPLTSNGNITFSINGANFKARVISDAQIKYTSTAADPTVAEFPNDKDFGFHINTTSTNRFFVYNNAGTIYKVQIT